ncbi:hypothetical protein [uncultured Roseobacter sp.]|uniref:hypothetical protein n=1 Tax=uncultured Roseobacter sp. TaxID=114847 RepID=UPI00261F03D4|nr:hypothetical protein [uncultured Roseobacter sp.]
MSKKTTPRVVKLYVRSAITGFVAAGGFVALVLWLNIANLGHLVAGSDIAVMAVGVFWVLNGIVFSGVQFAWAITAMAEPTGDGGSGGHAPGIAVPVPALAQGAKERRSSLL